jgi:hypothetical protein
MNDKLRSFLLWISVPLSIALAATGLQIFWPGVYWREKPISVAGGAASDILDLCLILPLLVASTLLARRGSLSALMIWAGTLGFLWYNFMIYAFEVHFNAMFPAYCAVLGLSFYGLVGVRRFLRPEEVAKKYSYRAPRRSMAAAFIVLTAIPAANELKDIVGAIRSGGVPPGIAETGQFTDPIHVLDLCFLLPAVAITAVKLIRREPLGFVLAPVLGVVMILISLEVLTIIAVMAGRGMPADYRPAVFFGLSTVALAALLGRYFSPEFRAKTPRAA